MQGQELDAFPIVLHDFAQDGESRQFFVLSTLQESQQIVDAVAADEPVTPVSQVDPGGEVLLSVRGWPKVAQVFRLIDAIEAQFIDPCDVAPDHWRHIHNRLAAHAIPRDYSPKRHRAWLQRKALLS